MKVWRIVKLRWTASAFDGEGAAKTGNRWNSKGVRMVYTSSTLSLAALELLVHADPSQLHAVAYVALAAEVPDHLIAARPSPAALPADWRAYPAPGALQRQGDDWVRGASSAALSVPSVVIPFENNVLLNPAHPDFRRISVSAPVPFTFDARLGPKP